MSSLSLVTCYNARLACCGWIFRIFVPLLVLVVLLLQVALQSRLSPLAVDGTSNMLPAFILFPGAYFFALFQIVPLLLVAGTVLDRSCHVDSSDVISYRPASNGDHVWGMALGIARPFLVAGVVTLAGSAAIHLLAGDAPFNGWLYLFYVAAGECFLLSRRDDRAM